MPFVPQSIRWPGTRAVLLVHGIGNASVGQAGSFPIDALKRALGDDEPNVAIYSINYDFINDWVAAKINFQAGITALKAALALKFGNATADAAIAESVGDVLWPVLSADLRLAVRDALIAQLDQIQLDRAISALEAGDDPLDYQVSIVAHSLGCFHTYEVLTAIAKEPAHQLRPASDLVTFDSVILMASPVQLIRTVAGAINALVPDVNTLATLSKPLAIPSDTKRKSRRVHERLHFHHRHTRSCGRSPAGSEADLGVHGHPRPGQHRGPATPVEHQQQGQHGACISQCCCSGWSTIERSARVGRIYR